MDEVISTALGRPVEISDLALDGDKSPERIRIACDRIARLLVELYLSGGLTWAQADTAANHIFLLMVRDCGDRVPDYAWDVYLAFDAGECTAPGGDATTKPLIEQIVARYASSQGSPEP
jgi:hypothetical protein